MGFRRNARASPKLARRISRCFVADVFWYSRPSPRGLAPPLPVFIAGPTKLGRRGNKILANLLELGLFDLPPNGGSCGNSARAIRRTLGKGRGIFVTQSDIR